MLPDSLKYLRDMLDRANLIRSYTTGKTLHDFETTSQLQDAVHWSLCIIGEAMSQLRRIDETTAQKLTGSVKIVGLRNQLIHGYSAIRSSITWSIVETHVPVLINELRELLGE